MSKLSHIDDAGRPQMVDVGDKAVTDRTAHARTVVHLPAAVRDAISGDEIQSKKGPVFATAIVAGVMAAKKTHELIPFCHPLGLDKADIAISLDGSDAIIDCRCRVQHRTGVEMEALTAVSTAALTVYDMLKAVDRAMEIGGIRVLLKDGGKSGRYEAGSTDGGASEEATP